MEFGIGSQVSTRSFPIDCVTENKMTKPFKKL